MTNRKSTQTVLDARLAARIRSVRLHRGLSQAELGAAAGLHRMAVQRAEAGERDLTVGEAVELASALDVPPVDLLLADHLVLTAAVRVD